jgi:hypothetical protein
VIIPNFIGNWFQVKETIGQTSFSWRTLRPLREANGVIGLLVRKSGWDKQKAPSGEPEGAKGSKSD